MENSLIERDKRVIWHPYTPQKYAPDPIPVVKGDGVYLIDTDGNYYIDAISSWWVNLHGHAHPYIAEKIYQQAKTLEQVIFAGFTHEPAIQLAERIMEILPGDFSKIFYSDNGSTAVEVALKMAVQFWWNEESEFRSQESGVRSTTKHRARNKIVALTNSYHGDTFGAMSVSDRGIFTLAFQDKLFEVIFIDANSLSDLNLVSRQEGSHEDTIPNSPLTIDLDEIACFIYEPLVQGAGGMKMYGAGSFNKLLKTFHEHGIICIADEVMTGFGRTGKLFASEYMEQKPDIICLSKGLTGGSMALGITACSKKIHDAFVSDDKLKTFFHGHSFTANPIACTAALASLDLLQKTECLRNIQRISEQHEEFIQRLIANNPSTIAQGDLQNNDPSTVAQDRRSTNAHDRTLTCGQDRLQTKNHRSLGTILAFEVITGNDEYLNNISGMMMQQALTNGVFLRPLGNTLYILPPYCITAEQLQKVYQVIIDILENKKKATD